MSKQDVLDQLRQARETLLAALDGLQQDALLRPGVVGLWSVKDILAHLCAWESELITALSKLDTQMPEIMKIEDINAWNADQYHLNAPRPLDMVLEDFEGVHKHLLQAVQALDDKTLNDARKFRWMEGEPLAYLVTANASWHEEEHAEKIQEWRKAQGL